MDDFADALAALGEKPRAPASGIPPGYLRSTIGQESGGNPNAVSPKGARGVMQVMPETNLAPGYGVTPARDNSEQERMRVGEDYLAAMHNHYKDPAIASIAYNMGPGATDKWLQSGGQFHKLPAETRNYVGAVMTGAAVNNRQGSAPPQQRQAPAAQPAAQDDDFTSALTALSGQAAAPDVAQAPAATAAQPAAAKGVPITQSLASAMPLPGVRLASMVAQKYLPQGMNPKVDTSGVTDAGKRLGAGAVSLGDTLGNGASGLIKQIDYAGRRAVGQTPEHATKQANEGVGSYFENPVSKFVNSAGKLINGTDPKIEESAGYKSEASSGVMKFIGDNIGKGAAWIGEKTGLPTADIENMMNTGLMGVTPTISKVAGKAGASAARYIDGINKEMAGNKPLSSMLKAGESPAPESSGTTMSLSGMAPAKPAYKLVNGKPVLIEPDSSIPAVTPPIGSAKPLGSKLSVPSEPQAPLTPAVAMPKTPESMRDTAQNNPAGLFPILPTDAPAGGRFSKVEQQARAEIMRSVGIDPQRMRESAITGDGLAGATDHQTSLVDSPAGRVMKHVLSEEKAAMDTTARGLISDAGGSTGMDQTTLVRRGNTTVSPFDKLREHLDQKTSDSYTEAHAIGDGVPANLTTLVDTLNDKSNLLTGESVLLRNAVKAHAKNLGMLQEDGSIQGTAKQAERLRQFIGKAYSYENSTFNIKLKDVIDEDVMKQAGGKIYEDSRALRKYRADTLDDPKGIANLTQSSGPEGINRKVPFEKIPDNLAGLPVAQFSHIVKTLKNMPPELADVAAASMAEIKGHFANQLHAIGSKQAGQWNAKGTSQFLQDNASRMAEVFTPDEMAKFRNLNDAGHILAKSQAYPGAAVQEHNLLTKGTMAGAHLAGAGIGGAVFGPLGAMGGAYAGKAIAARIGDAAALKAVNGRMVKLSDLAKTK